MPLLASYGMMLETFANTTTLYCDGVYSLNDFAVNCAQLGEGFPVTSAVYKTTGVCGIPVADDVLQRLRRMLQGHGSTQQRHAAAQVLPGGVSAAVAVSAPQVLICKSVATLIQQAAQTHIIDTHVAKHIDEVACVREGGQCRCWGGGCRSRTRCAS